MTKKVQFLNYGSLNISMDQKGNLPDIKTVLSAIEAAVSMSITNPFNLVRFRMQTMPDLIIQKQLDAPYTGLKDCFRRVYHEQGLRAFWKGNGSNIIRFYPVQALTFALKDIFNRHLSKLFSKVKNQSPHINTLSGVLSGCITLTMLYPLEFARLKLINHVKGEKHGATKIIWETFKAQGLNGIFRGSLMSYMGITIFRGVYFGIYDTYKISANNYIDKIMISYLSTVAALFGIYPFDTVRRRLMMTSGQQYKYGSYKKIIKQIYGNAGLRGFFPGLPVIFFEASTIGVMFVLFDDLFCEQNLQN